MTLSAHQGSTQDIFHLSSGQCALCASAHAPSERAYFPSNYHGMSTLKKQLFENRTRKFTKSNACTCECHKLVQQLKKSIPVIDTPFPYSQAQGIRRDPSFEERANAYFTNEGTQLKQYLQNQGREFYTLESIGTTNLENAIAAVAREGNQAILIGNNNFESKVEELACFYRVSQNIARRYVFDHETVHLSQKGKNFDDHFAAEYDVEGTLKDYYNTLSRKEPGNADYKALAGIAQERHARVPKNYAPTASNKN